jgi:ribose transport system substrate-binding protein
MSTSNRSFRHVAIAALAGLSTFLFEDVSTAQQAGGITDRIVLSEFRPDAAPCSAPTGLTRKIVFAQDNNREFMEGVKHGLQAAAEDRGLEFETRLADNDATRMIIAVDQALSEHVGGLVASPVNPASLAPHLQSMIASGAYVGTIVPPPAVSLLNAPQYLTGKVLAEAAAAFIEKDLGGKAKVVLLTHDKLQFLAPRFTAMRDVLSRIPGVEFIADISPLTVDKKGGESMMQTIMLANSDVDVVLGADTVVLGALAAVRKAGKERKNQFFGGIDGEPEAIAEIQKGGSFKTTVSLASPIFAYAMGQHAADWLDGKSIPQAMDILPTLLESKSIASYEADVANPKAVYADVVRRRGYLKMYGNICFDTRQQYINFPWDSEKQ